MVDYPSRTITAKFKKKDLVNYITVADVTFNDDATGAIFSIEASYVTDIDIGLRMIMQYWYRKPDGSTEFEHLDNTFTLPKGQAKWRVEYPFLLLDPSWVVTKESVRWTKAPWDDFITPQYTYSNNHQSGGIPTPE